MTFQSHLQHVKKNAAYIKGVMFFVAVVVVEIKQSQEAGKQSIPVCQYLTHTHRTENGLNKGQRNTGHSVS